VQHCLVGSEMCIRDRSITLMPSYSNVESYSWSPKTFLDDSTKKFPVSSPKNTITYALKVATNKGCIDTASVKVIYGLDVYIPKTFSPNGDKINDTWVIEGIENYRKHSVKLFDRFGQIILNTNNYQAWDGRKNGENVPIGTYYYIVQLDATMQAITGFVTIFR
jgi:gliding motility-associated-like protein